MSAVIRYILIVVLLLTSQGLAAARGQSRIAGEMVLCAGGELVTVTVDQDGNPVERLTICPDMALNLMSAVAVQTPWPRLTDSIQSFPPAMAVEQGQGRDSPVAQARDPPTRWTT